MAKFEPKVGQYWYQLFHKLNGNVWRVWLRNAENSDSKVNDFFSKDEAAQFVRKMNGWGK